MKRFAFVTMLLIFAATAVRAGEPLVLEDRVQCPDLQAESRRIINVPNLPGYVTVKCDFHIHSDISDGWVTPESRVREAWADGLDLISVTDHIGYHPYTKEVPDYNQGYERANKIAKRFGMLVVKGVEITRDKPFGHICALFLKDCNTFSERRYYLDENGEYKRDENGNRIPDRRDEISDFEAAVAQDAFIHWNHPGWPDGKCTLFDFHRERIEKGQIHAVEIGNKCEWYPKALEWMDKYGLPMTANSDLHHPSGFTYSAGNRPINLVFAKERSVESVREAMFAGRVVAFFDSKLVGKREYVEPLVREALKVKVINGKKNYVEISNPTDLVFRINAEGFKSEVLVGPRRAVWVKLAKGQTVTFTNVYHGASNLEITLR